MPKLPEYLNSLILNLILFLFQSLNQVIKEQKISVAWVCMQYSPVPLGGPLHP